IAERSGERVENRGLEKEVAPPCVERAEDDLREVVDDVAVRAVESRHEPVGIGRVTQRERGQVDAGRPALGARVEDIQRLGSEPETELLVEEGSLLVLREAEIEGAELQQPALGAELRHGDRRVGAARDDELDATRLRFHEVGEGLMAGRGVDGLVVVEHEGELHVQRLELPDDDRDQRVEHVYMPRLERDLRGVAEVRPNPADGFDDPRPERNRVVVGGVSSEPREGTLLLLAPLRQEGRLAEAGRRRKQDERRGRAEQLRAQAWPRDHLRRGREPAELRFEKADAVAPLTDLTEEGPATHPGLDPSSGAATSPSLTASTAACVLELTPILRSTFETWVRAVRSLITSSAAISLLAFPAPTRRRTSSSRLVRRDVTPFPELRSLMSGLVTAGSSWISPRCADRTAAATSAGWESFSR